MRDYIDYQIARRQEAWEEKIPPLAVRRAVWAKTYLTGASLLGGASLIAVLVLALTGVFMEGYFYVSLFLFMAFFLLGRAREHSLAAAEEVVAHYGLPLQARRHFTHLTLESFPHRLKRAQEQASVPPAPPLSS